MLLIYRDTFTLTEHHWHIMQALEEDDESLPGRMLFAMLKIAFSGRKTQFSGIEAVLFADLSQPIVSENLELKRKWEIGWNNFVEDFNNIPGATNIKIIT